VKSLALQLSRFPCFDYSGYSFALGLAAGDSLYLWSFRLRALAGERTPDTAQVHSVLHPCKTSFPLGRHRDVNERV